MSLGPTVAPESDDLSIVLIERYCAGTVSPAERAQVESWVLAHPDAVDWSPTPAAEIIRRAQTIMRQARERSTRPALKRIGVSGTQPLRPWRWYTLAGAALTTVALIVGWSRGIWRPHDATSAPMLTYLTGAGERASITLPDGSTVSLDVASRLNVPADYLAGNHTLRLEGEALFTVRHQLGIPLTVNTGAVRARVLGTSFLLRHYATDTTTLVAVSEGRVAVQANQARTVVLTAAQQVAIGRATLRERETDPAAFSFAAGVLTFTGGLFTDAIPELDRWYDVDIRLGDSALVGQRLTGEYAAGSLADLKDLLQLTYNIRVVQDGRVLTLYRRK
jgi:transmembrane sensor